MVHAILVVIPTLNEADAVADVLTQLSQDLPPGCRVQFVVVDGGSRDGTVAIVHRVAATRSDLAILHNPARIQSAAINLAVRTFGQHADLLVRCDAHAAYPIGYIRALVETFDTVGCDSVVVAMDSVGTHGLQKAVALVSDTRLGSGGAAHRGRHISGFVDHGHHALIRLSSFCRLGGYDESFSHNEDAEFDCRLRATGGTVFLDSAIRIRYQPRSRFSTLWRQYYSYGKGRSRTARRHPHSIRLRQLAVPTYLGSCLLSLAATPLWPSLATPTLLYLGALAAASVRFGLGVHRVAGLLTGPAAFVMHSAWATGFVVGLMTIRTARWHIGMPANLTDQTQDRESQTQIHGRRRLPSTLQNATPTQEHRLLVAGPPNMRPSNFTARSHSDVF